MDAFHASLSSMSLPDTGNEYERQVQYQDVIEWCTELLVSLEDKQQELLARITQMDETLAKCDMNIDPRVQEAAKKYCMARAKGARKIMMPGHLLSHMTARKHITSNITRLHHSLEVLNNKYELFLTLYRTFMDDADNSSFAHELQTRVHMMNRVKQDDDVEGGERWIHLETQLSELRGYIAEANDNKGSVFDQLKELGDTIRSNGGLRSGDVAGVGELSSGATGDMAMHSVAQRDSVQSSMSVGGVSDSDFSMIQAIAGFELGEFGEDSTSRPPPVERARSTQQQQQHVLSTTTVQNNHDVVVQRAEEQLDGLLA